jgi:hypothetical protein
LPKSGGIKRWLFLGLRPKPVEDSGFLRHLLFVQEVRLEIIDLLNLGVNGGLLSRDEPGGRQ